MVRSPTNTEWEAAIGGRGAYPWGARFDPTRLNCAEGWAERRFSSQTEWLGWLGSNAESRREASTTAVTTYPQGVSKTRVWDGSGNVLEWMDNLDAPGHNEKALRGSAWLDPHRDARVSDRSGLPPDSFSNDMGVRVVVGPVLK
jgi:formylglycine-generating enzyme required for sulfatase activity